MNREERRRLQARYPGAENLSVGGVSSVEREFELWQARQPKVCPCGSPIELLQWETPTDLRTSPWCSSCMQYRGDIFVVAPHA